MDAMFPRGSKLDDLHRLHEYSKKIVFSAVSEDLYLGENTKYQNRKEPYEPSMFIYSYFVYNTLYNIDWKKSQRDNYSTFPELKGTQDHLRNAFISLVSVSPKSSEWFSQSFRKGILKYIKRKDGGISSNSINQDDNRRVILSYWVSRALNGIKVKPDNPGGVSVEGELEAFRNSINMVLTNRSLTNKDYMALDALIYKVRCNLFHGSKNFYFFEESGQNERLAIYAVILSSMCDVFFKTVSETMNGLDDIRK